MHIRNRMIQNQHFTYGVLNSRPRRGSHALPCDERLLTAQITCSDQLMIDWKVTDVTNLRAGTLERWAFLLLIVAMCRDSNACNSSRSGLRREPNHDIFPVVAVTETGGGGVFRHVPTVHNSVLAIVGSSTGINLACGGRATIIGAAGVCESPTKFMSGCGNSGNNRKVNLPSVSRRVNCREGNTSIENLEVWLVLQHQCSYGARRYGLSKAHDCIMVDDCSLLNIGGQRRDACRSCKELES